jgi:hypothetical protein
MHLINLFKKSNEFYNISVGTDTEKGIINMPMYNTNFTLYKGVPNTIFFSVRNNDRKRVELSDNQSIHLVMINQELQIELDKTLVVVDASVGKYQITFTEEDMRLLEPATYLGHVAIYNDDDSDVYDNGVQELLYSSENWQSIFNIEVVPNRMEICKESVEIENFSSQVYVDYRGKTVKEFISSNIKSNVTPYHSFFMVLKNFVGKFIIEGSLETIPQQNDSDWFKIKEYTFTENSTDDSDDDITPVSYTVECACQWLRIKYIIDNDDYVSEVSEILYRN